MCGSILEHCFRKNFSKGFHFGRRQYDMPSRSLRGFDFPSKKYALILHDITSIAARLLVARIAAPKGIFKIFDSAE
jgi:hypothetical protein